MLDSLGRFSSTQPFSHRYNIFVIRRFDKKNLESWLKQTFIRDYSDWMVQLENDPYKDEAPEPKLTRADVSTFIQTDEFIKSDRFIEEQLNIGLTRLIPEADLFNRFKHSNYLAAWKVADQLMFMCDQWEMDLPSWRIILKTAHFESHIMCTRMKFGLVFIYFYYPSANSILKKDTSYVLDGSDLL
jgi:hypothetical protein